MVNESWWLCGNINEVGYIGVDDLYIGVMIYIWGVEICKYGVKNLVGIWFFKFINTFQNVNMFV